MTATRKGLILGAVQLLLVASLGAKFAADRARFPRVWAPTVAYDPDLPIRGRYLSVRLRVDASRVYETKELPNNVRGNFWGEMRDVYLHAEAGHLVASPAPRPTGVQVTRWRTATGEEVATLFEPVSFFLPEHALDPSRRKPGEQLWVEVTVPKKGPPRPIRLAVKRGDMFTPLDIK